MSDRMFSKIAVVMAALSISSCGGSSNMPPPERSEADVAELFAGEIDDERETVIVAPVDQSVEQYQISQAAFDTVIVRPVPSPDGGPRRAEALLKGAFPDACTELHEIQQESATGGVSVELTMRRPVSQMCAQVVRPYRFFFELESRFQPGSHTLVVNGRPFHFNVE